MKNNVLITGACGFIGSHLADYLHTHTNWNIYIIDKLSYASNGMDRIREMGLLDSPRVKVLTYDLCNPISEGIERELGDIHYIIHMAAETHVDNSIRDPVGIIHNNVMSTVQILEYSRRLKNLQKFFYFSTDETYGSAPDDVEYRETDRHNPGNPYSASKSCGEQICVSYHNTYKTPLIMVNVMNVIGIRQYMEKFIPKCISYIQSGKSLYIHGNEDGTVSGSRFYIHAYNVANAVLFLVKNGKIGELYHVKGERELSNLQIAQFIADEMALPLNYEIVGYHADRPGNDFRYALDGTKLYSLGWSPYGNFDDSLREIIQWSLKNPKWLK